MVLVDIRETPSAKAADIFLQIRPGKDFEVVDHAARAGQGPAASNRSQRRRNRADASSSCRTSSTG